MSASSHPDGSSSSADVAAADLAAIGLTTACVEMYQYALSDPDWTLESYTQRTGRTAEDAHDALDSLVAARLFEPSLEDRASWVPTPPRVGITRLIESEEARLWGEQRSLAKTRLTAEEFIDRLHTDEETREAVEILDGQDSTVNRISELFSEASSARSMVTSLPDDHALKRAREGVLEVLVRGVGLRLLCLSGHLRRSHAVREHLATLRDAGAEVRLAPYLPTRLMIFDENVALLPSDPTDTSRGAIAVHEPGLVSLAESLFEMAWEGAREIEDDSSSTPEDWAPSDLEREVIKFLAMGNKDEAIGRRIGLSLRSVRRMISKISDELGAASRFELGVKCAQRGLL